MIKCFGFGKLLKPLFSILLIGFFGLLGNSFVNGEWIYRNVNEQFMSPGSSTYSQKILSSSAGILEGAGTTKALIYGKYNNNSSNNRLATFWWGVDNKLYGYVPKAGSNVRFAYRKYTYLGVFAGTGFEVLTTNQMSNGIPEDNKFSADTYYSNSNFINKVSRFAYYMDSSTSLRYSFCWIFDSLNTSICIFNIEGFYDELGTSATASNDYNPPISGLSHIPADFDNSLIGTSPWVSNVPTPGGNNQVGNGGELEGINYTMIDTGDIVYYFENNPYYRYDKGVCYVGTYDYTTLYSNGSTLGLFRASSGGTVFDLFSSQFGNTFSINQVGTFINAWNLNYYTWFKGGNRDENNVPMFNAYYSINSGFYQDFSDDLTVPFIGNPIAFYFMGYVSSLYGEYSTPGQSISTYCYYKLGLDKDSGSMNITDDSDSSYWNNASDFITQRNKFYGLNSGNMVIQSQSWSGTILDYFTGGNDNYDFNSFFSSSFNKFKNVINLNSNDLISVGYLPGYIILFFVALIFFRFLSR